MDKIEEIQLKYIEIYCVDCIISTLTDVLVILST